VAVAERDGSAPLYVNRCREASSLLPMNPEGARQWAGGEALGVEATAVGPTIRVRTLPKHARGAGKGYPKNRAQRTRIGVIRSLGDRIKDVQRIELEVQVAPVPLYSGADRKEAVMEFLDRSGFRLVRSAMQSRNQEENLTFQNSIAPL